MDARKKKVLIVATVVQTHIAAFHVPTMKMLKENGWIVEVASHNDYENPKDMNLQFCDKFYEIPFDRNPCSTSNIKAYKMLKKVIDEGKYDVVHCHTPVGGVLTRLAAREARKHGTKVFYTAHGFHFFNGGPIVNWVYYPVEYVLSKMTDILFTINNEDYQRASKHFLAKSTVKLPGIGINYDRFANCKVDKITKRRELGIPDDGFVVLSVGELTKRKNHQTIIKALSMLNNDSIHYVICGRCKEYQNLVDLARLSNIENSVHFLGFRYDIEEICRAADIFAFPSRREGLGLSAIEAMASGLPVIGSNINGIMDYSINLKTGLYFHPNDVNSFASAIDDFYNDKFFNFNPKLNSQIAERYSTDYVLSILSDYYFNLDISLWGQQ